LARLPGEADRYRKDCHPNGGRLTLPLLRRQGGSCGLAELAASTESYPLNEGPVATRNSSGRV
jgi:hypothetical protein